MRRLERLGLLIVVVLTCWLAQASGQAAGGSRSYQVAVIGFYNCENLLDPASPDQRARSARTRYDSIAYKSKITGIATAISMIGKEFSKDGACLIGLVELEDRTVLEDLVHHPALASRHYRICHYDSRDVRGMDVALLYNPDYFLPFGSAALPVEIRTPGETARSWYSRDILFVSGTLCREPFILYVNHWPSRRGGEARSQSARASAAAVCRHHLDSLLGSDPEAKICVMGDFNDDPESPSIRKVLRALPNRNPVIAGSLFNPWVDFYRHGKGTIAFRDAWSLFDQILPGGNLLDSSGKGWFFYRAGIVRDPALMETAGRFAGYPKRSWSGDAYVGGMSDHLPVYITLIRKSR